MESPILAMNAKEKGKKPRQPMTARILLLNDEVRTRRPTIDITIGVLVVHRLQLSEDRGDRCSPLPHPGVTRDWKLA